MPAGSDAVTEPVEGREAQRVEAFSDGVMAVIITIMVLELPRLGPPRLSSLRQEIPSLLVYLLSFVVIGIYWNNHHHLLRASERINAGVMWANLHLLFWLSLIPFITEWVGRYDRSALPASAYGVVAALAGVAYFVLTRAIIWANGGANSKVARAIGSDVKGVASVVLYLLGVGFAWVTPWIAYGLYVAVSIMWFIPDRRLERPAPAGGPL
jgi:TMEM175 potassium channel family protein